MDANQKSISVAAVARACRFFHTQSGLAMVLGISQSQVSRLVTGEAELSAADAVRIEKATGGAVVRWLLRPDIYAKPAKARSLAIGQIRAARELAPKARGRRRSNTIPA